jgi:CubicO group peptidase (beta-lactamase class C family)
MNTTLSNTRELFLMKLYVVVVLAVVANGLQASELPTANPETVGFSSERLKKISEFTQRAVDEGQHAGFVTLVARHGKIVHFESVGQYGIDNDQPMDKDALFRIFSMTKPVTAFAMMMLYEEDKFQMTDPVSKYLPSLANQKLFNGDEPASGSFNPTIEQLFTHTAGFTYGFRRDSDAIDAMYHEIDLINSADLDDFISKLSQIPLRFEPGKRYHYSVSYDILGAIVEKLSGQSLDVFFRERIFEPLAMNDTFFSVPQEKLSRLATNHYWDGEQNALVAAPPDDLFSNTEVTFFSGGGGLVSTAMDYMVFCEMLRRGGSYLGARILGPKTIQYMTMNHLTPEVRNNGATDFPESHLYKGQYMGLGFGIMLEPEFSEVISSKGAYSWGGAAGTKFWVDPEEDLVVILMTQLMWAPIDQRYPLKIATYQALTELGSD